MCLKSTTSSTTCWQLLRGASLCECAMFFWRRLYQAGPAIPAQQSYVQLIECYFVRCNVMCEYVVQWVLGYGWQIDFHQILHGGFYISVDDILDFAMKDLLNFVFDTGSSFTAAGLSPVRGALLSFKYGKEAHFLAWKAALNEILVYQFIVVRVSPCCLEWRVGLVIQCSFEEHHRWTHVGRSETWTIRVKNRRWLSGDIQRLCSFWTGGPLGLKINVRRRGRTRSFRFSGLYRRIVLLCTREILAKSQQSEEAQGPSYIKVWKRLQRKPSSSVKITLQMDSSPLLSNSCGRLLWREVSLSLLASCF